jgi:hypothetical protein
VVLFFPRTIAVMLAAGRTMMMADSLVLDGANPLAWISACWLSCQLSLEVIGVPLPSYSSSVGSARTFGNVKSQWCWERDEQQNQVSSEQGVRRRRAKTGVPLLAPALRRCRDEIPKHLKVPNPSKLRDALRQFALKGALAGLLSARWLAQQEIAHGMKCSLSFCFLLARFSSSR